MGHYDQSRAHDEAVTLTAKQQKAQWLKSRLDDFLIDIGKSGIKVPPRFAGSFEDFDNWLTKTYGTK